MRYDFVPIKSPIPGLTASFAPMSSAVTAPVRDGFVF
jgi:hypothetical protein